MNSKLDETDLAILKQRIEVRDKIEGPRLGDYVLFGTGQLERFSHDWDDALQTSPSGSYFVYASGSSEFSGGLNPQIPVESLEPTRATLPGTFWFFHHDYVGAGRRVDCVLPCRVYKTSAPYKGYLGKEFASSAIDALKAELNHQLSGEAITS